VRESRAGRKNKKQDQKKTLVQSVFFLCPAECFFGAAAYKPFAADGSFSTEKREDERTFLKTQSFGLKNVE
jgi:hypothetical protein